MWVEAMMYMGRGTWGSDVRAEEVRHASQNADSACPFCIGAMAKKGTLSQHFGTHVVDVCVYVTYVGKVRRQRW